MDQNENPYEDIIHLPHPTSRKHPRMSAENRAAQFSPFSVLKGYGGKLRETAAQSQHDLEASEMGVSIEELIAMENSEYE